MTSNDKIRDEKLQHDNSRKPSKIVALSFRKTDQRRRYFSR